MIPQDRVHAGAGGVAGKEAAVLVIIGMAVKRAEGARQVRERGVFLVFVGFFFFFRYLSYLAGHLDLSPWLALN